MKTLVLFLLSALTALGQSVELRSVTILGGVEIGQAAAAVASAVTSPTNASPTFWFRAQDLTNADGTFMDWWPDLGSNAYHLIGTTGERPKYKDNILNGHGAVLFEEDDLQCNTSFSVAQPYWLFAVVLFTNAAQWDFICTGTNAADAVGLARESDEQWRLRAPDVVSVDSMVANVWYVVSAHFNGSSSLLRTNKVQIASGLNPGAGAWTGIRVGADPLTGGSQMSGWIPEVFLLTNNLSATEITNVENYLLGRYGL